MPLSPKQLKLVFAKLRAKGLLKYIKKPKHPRVSVVYEQKAFLNDPLVAERVLKRGKSVLSAPDILQLVKKLPAHHIRQTQRVSTVLHDDFDTLKSASGEPDLDRGTRGFFNKAKMEINVLRASTEYSSDIGYTRRPLYRARLPYAEKTLEVYLTRTKRSAKVGSRAVFYHEYAHALDNVSLASREDAWRRIVEQSGEWSMEGVTEVSTWAPGVPVGTYVLKPSESFAEGYASYALSATSRNRLRKERPQTFEYMEKFFGHKRTVNLVQSVEAAKKRLRKKFIPLG